MPLSTLLFLACLAVLKWLFVAAGAGLLLVALRAWFDSGVAMPPGRGVLGAGIFFITALAIHLIRNAIARRAGLNRFDKLDG